MPIGKDEIVSMVLALEDIAADGRTGVNGLRFMCRRAALLIRDMRPDLAFREESTTNGGK